MATITHHHFIGIDVSKAELVICDKDCARSDAIQNTAQSIRHWLDCLPAGRCAVALEATSTYHIELVHQAYAKGHTVYLLDGFRLNRYRESIGTRAKTDCNDAILLRRYLTREIDDLRPWEPAPEGYDDIQRLIRRRANLVQHSEAIRQSIADLELPTADGDSVFAELKKLIQAIEKQIAALMKSVGWNKQQARCSALEGFGKLTSTAVTVAWHRANFRSADAFVSYVGLDVRIRDSGRQQGRRKLTKKGDPELRRLLYCASMAAARSATWKPFYEACIARGMKPIQAYVALARKLLRVAFSILKSGNDYIPGRPHVNA